MATWIVNHTGEWVEKVLEDGHTIMVNPAGYQCVLYATIVLYIVALVLSVVLVKPSDKALAAKQKKAE